MAVAAVTVDQIVFRFIEDGGGADGDGFLPAVEMAEPADFLARAGVFLVGAFLEAADEESSCAAACVPIVRPTRVLSPVGAVVRDQLQPFRCSAHFRALGGSQAVYEIFAARESPILNRDSQSVIDPLREGLNHRWAIHLAVNLV